MCIPTSIAKTYNVHIMYALAADSEETRRVTLQLFFFLLKYQELKD